jgi:hypothetical protein
VPRIEEWIILNYGTWSQATGKAYDDPRCVDGTPITTSYIRRYSLTEKKLTTKNTTYILGAPASNFTPPPEEDVVLK